MTPSIKPLALLPFLAALVLLTGCTEEMAKITQDAKTQRHNEQLRHEYRMEQRRLENAKALAEIAAAQAASARRKLYAFLEPTTQFLSIVMGITLLIFTFLQLKAKIENERLVQEFRRAEIMAEQETARQKQQLVIAFVSENIGNLSDDERKMIFQNFTQGEIKRLDDGAAV